MAFLMIALLVSANNTMDCDMKGPVSCKIESYLSEDKENRTYKVFGQVFFASAEVFYNFFDFKEVVQHVTIDVSNAHFWDLSAVGALDKVVMKFRREGTAVDLIGLNEASATIVDRLAVYDKPDALELMLKQH